MTHLLIVDAILVLCDWSRRNMEKLHDILNLFSEASGMKVNEGKPSLLGEGLYEEELDHYKKLFPYIVFGFGEGLKCLGSILKPISYIQKYWD